MNANLPAAEVAHDTRLKLSEDVISSVTKDCDDLERWQASCHIYHAQMEEIRRAAENNLRARSSDAETRTLVKELRARTAKILQEAETLKKCTKSLEEKSKIVQEAVDKENSLFPHIEDVFPSVLKAINTSN